MAAPEEINADMLAFWNGKGGDIWVARQEHTDITLAPVTDAFLAFAAPRAGERVVDIGCGCGTCTLEFARAVNPSGRVAGLDISGPMLAEGERRASAAGITKCRLAAGRSGHGRAGRIRFVDLGLRRDVFWRSGGGVHQYAPRRCPGRAHGSCVLANAGRKPVDGGADDCSRAAPAAAAESGRERSRNVRLCRSRPRDRGAHRGRLDAAALRETRHGPRYRRRPGAAGGLWFSQPKSAP